jgi:hypothetical protein
MKVLKQLLFTKTCISGLSPESSVIKEIHLAGLLACSLFTAFPPRFNRNSGAV